MVSQIIHDFPEATKAVVALVTALITLKGLGFAGGVGRALLGLGGGGAAAAAGGEGAAAAAGAGGFPLLAAAGGAYALGINPATGLPRAVEWGEKIGQGLPALIMGGGNFGSIIGGYLGRGVNPNAAQGGGLLRHSGGGQGAPSGDTSTLAGRARLAEATLMAAGFTAEQAKGITAGLFAESAGTLSASAKNPKSTAYGIAQWIRTGGRQDDFRAWAGHDIHQSTFQEQLQFLLFELHHKQGRLSGRSRGPAARVTRRAPSSTTSKRRGTLARRWTCATPTSSLGCPAAGVVGLRSRLDRWWSTPRRPTRELSLAT